MNRECIFFKTEIQYYVDRVKRSVLKNTKSFDHEYTPLIHAIFKAELEFNG